MEAENHFSDESRRRGSKRNKPSGDKVIALDRISSLPDPLLLHILSLLLARDAVSTSVLSKRWQYLWTYMSILNLDYYGVSEEDYYMGLKGRRRFISFINHTLLLYRSPKIEEFHVRMYYMKAYAYEVDVWVAFAMRKNVQELELSLPDAESHYYSDEYDEEDDDGSCYILPSYVLSNASLVTLKLSNCEIERCRLINWKSLKVLSLCSMSLSNNLIRDILSGSPSVELLEISSCYNYNYIDIKSERLRKLVISYYNLHRQDQVSNNALRISAPNVQSLDISGMLKTEIFSLINSSSSLVDANFNLYLWNEYGDFERSREVFTKILRELLEKVRHVKDLTVGSWCLQVLSVLEEKAMPCPLSNRVCLRIITLLREWELPGITRLLALTPLLDTLVIEMASHSFSGMVFEPGSLESLDLSGGNYWSSQKSLLAVTLLNLKIVKIVDFKGSEKEIELILFMLKNARRLEKMIIRRRKLGCTQLEESLLLAERLLSFPRCSPDAVVLFSELGEKV